MPPEPAPGGTKQDQAKKLKLRFLAAERQQESGGDYTVVNQSSGALGAWQVMPANLPGWLRASGLPPMTDQQYLDSHAAQNRLAWVILGGYYDEYGAAGAAAMWYSGQPDPHATYGDPPVYQYVDDVLAIWKGNPGIQNLGINQAVNTALGQPPANEDDWSTLVRSAGDSHKRAAGTVRARAAELNKIR